MAAVAGARRSHPGHQLRCLPPVVRGAASGRRDHAAAGENATVVIIPGAGAVGAAVADGDAATVVAQPAAGDLEAAAQIDRGDALGRRRSRSRRGSGTTAGAGVVVGAADGMDAAVIVPGAGGRRDHAAGIITTPGPVPPVDPDGSHPGLTSAVAADRPR